MKKLLVCLLALLLAAAPALGEEAADGSAHAFEGSGFDSPEEAVTAYLEAMQEGDVQGMLSTFAIETYVDNVDAQTYLTRMGAFVPDDQEGVPLSNAYAREIAISRRYAGLADQLYMQYLYYSWPEEYGEFTGDALRLNEAGRGGRLPLRDVRLDVRRCSGGDGDCRVRRPCGAERQLCFANQSGNHCPADDELRLRRGGGHSRPSEHGRRGMVPVHVGRPLWGKMVQSFA